MYGIESFQLKDSNEMDSRWNPEGRDYPGLWILINFVDQFIYFNLQTKGP